MFCQSLVKFEDFSFQALIEQLPFLDIPIDSNEGPIFSNPRITIHGIDIPKNTDLLWLYQHMSFPDNFLHIVVI